MDPRSRLDYVLFQLTPTRTRCDLVICAGDCKEKLASGLLEPFLTHLEFAKEQISKGGYSITLSASASWFTKSTLERFVKFVSTPEVIERFITIEQEIANIDHSIHSNPSSDTQTAYGLEEYSSKFANSAYKHEFNSTSDATHEEDSKVHLQRVLETRREVLQKEQAMVYARALVAGFETDNLEDLICFANAFGSPRLRDACVNFMELCNTKSSDGVWMDEVAAMQAYSRSQYSYMGTSGGIIPSGDDDPSQELRINVHNGNFATKRQNGAVEETSSVSSLSHGSYLPQYTHDYQGRHMFPPPYQGYPFPSMVVPPYYQGNLPRPPSVDDFRSRGKRSPKKGSRRLKQDGNFDSSDSSSRSDSGNNRRSSSRKVIIRNKTEGKPNGGSFKQDPDRTVEDKPEGQEVTQQWDIFQNLLLKDADDRGSEEVKKPCDDSSDPFATKSSTIGRHKEGEWFIGSRPDEVVQEKSRDIFEDNVQPVANRKDVLVDDPLAVEARSLDHSPDSQWRTQDISVVSESNLIQKASYPPNKKLQENVEGTCVDEPNDLYIVLERGTASQQPAATWTPEMESGNSYKKVVRLDSADNENPASRGKETKTRPKVSDGQVLERKGSTMEAKSKALVGSLDIISRSKKSSGTKTPIQKGKSEKEEDKRKKMEELLAQRKKRIAERSAYRATTAKIDKPKAQPASRDTKRSNKPVISSSTIDRLSAARVIHPKVLPTEPKPGNKPRKPTTNENGVSRTSFSHRTARAEEKKGKPNKVKHPDKNIGSKNANGPKEGKITGVNNARQLRSASPVKQIGNGVAADLHNVKQVRSASPVKQIGNGVAADLHNVKQVRSASSVRQIGSRVAADLNNVKQLRGASSARKIGIRVGPDNDVKQLRGAYSVRKIGNRVGPDNDVKQLRGASSVRKIGNRVGPDNDVKQSRSSSSSKKIGNGVARVRLTVPANHESAQSDDTKGASGSVHNSSPVRQEDTTLSETLHGSSISAKKASNSVSFRINEDSGGGKENPIVKMKITTPPPGEGSNSRKKWSNGEALNGLRKLLSFGRRS